MLSLDSEERSVSHMKLVGQKFARGSPEGGCATPICIPCPGFVRQFGCATQLEQKVAAVSGV
jgi:hypothetical protein